MNGEEQKKPIVFFKWFRSLEETGIDPSAWATIRAWIYRGDGAAIYVNADFGSSMLGHRKCWSYGSRLAMLEVESADELPDRLPDLPNEINWRYRLEGVYRPMEQPDFYKTRADDDDNDDK